MAVNKNTPLTRSKIRKWLFLFEGIIAAAFFLLLFLTMIEGLTGWNVLPGPDKNALWIWGPVSRYTAATIIYVAVLLTSLVWAVRRFYLFAHPERESAFRLPF